jgi:signal transduction histidine kinase
VGGDGGLGLVSMRERLHSVGGRVVIDSRPGGGTRVQVCVPLGDLAESADAAAAPSPCEADLVIAETVVESSA